MLQSSRLACFSSIGPTSDGRIKPDVVAPGDFIQSAWSGDPSLTLKALLEGKDWKGAPTCAVHQMSGTSMATPVTGNLMSESCFAERLYRISLKYQHISISAPSLTLSHRFYYRSWNSFASAAILHGTGVLGVCLQ